MTKGSDWFSQYFKITRLKYGVQINETRVGIYAVFLHPVTQQNYYTHKIEVEYLERKAIIDDLIWM